MSPRPDLWHQRISERLTLLLDDPLPDALEAVPRDRGKAGIKNYWIIDPEALADERFLAHRLDAGSSHRVAVLDVNRVRANEPTALELALDMVRGR